jgi:hypothetical protein
MKKLFLAALSVFFSVAVLAQVDNTIDKGAGWVYFSGEPGTVVQECCYAETAINVLTGEAWIWDRVNDDWVRWYNFTQLDTVPTADPGTGPFATLDTSTGQWWWWNDTDGEWVNGAAVMTGATGATDGASGLVPQPVAGDENKYLKGDGTWGTLSGDIPTTIGSLDDVSISAPVNGQTIVWQDSLWVNQALNVDDADADSTNEIQQIDTLSFDGTILSGSLSGDGVPADTADLSSLEESQAVIDTATAIRGDMVRRIGQLNDVDTSGVSTGKILKFNGVTWAIADDDGSMGSDSLGDLADVVLTGPTAGEILYFNGFNWIADSLDIEDGDADPTNEIQDFDVATFVDSTNRLRLSLEGEVTTYSIDLSGLNDSIPLSDTAAVLRGLIPESFGDLGDVTLTSPLDSALVFYDSLNGVWIDGPTIEELRESAGGGSPLTVEEVDGSPSVSSVTEINFDQDDGFSVVDDGSGVVTINFSGAGTDNQTIDTLQLSGDTLQISLSGDNEPLQTLDLSSLGGGSGTDTSGYNISLNLAGTVLELTDGDGTLSEDLAALQDGTGTDDQVIDTIQLNGTNLEISLENDGQALRVVDLSGLQDGTGTDDQTLTSGSFNLSNGILSISIENGNTQNINLDGRYLQTEADGSTVNELQDLSLSNDSLSIENGNTVVFTDWDTDVTDDFSGSWNDLSDIPSGFADDVDDVGVDFTDSLSVFVTPTQLLDSLNTISDTDTSGYNLSLNLNGNTLELTDGNGVVSEDLSIYLDNQNLSQVLVEGNSAGNQDIDMNHNDIVEAQIMRFRETSVTSDEWVIGDVGTGFQFGRTLTPGSGSFSPYMVLTENANLVIGGFDTDTKLDVEGGIEGDTIRVEGAYQFSTDVVSTSPGDTLVQVWVDSTTAFFLDKSEFGSAGGGSDDQTIDVLQMNGNNLEISLEDDGEPNQSVDLSQFLDDTNLTQEEVEDFVGGMLTGTQAGIVVAYDDPNGELDFTVTGGGGSGETNVGDNLGAGEPVFAQKVDTTFQFKTITEGSNISLTGSPTELQISAQDTSGYNSSVSLAGTTLQITDGNGTVSQDLASLQDGTGTDDQTIDALQLTGTTLEVSLENDGQPLQTVDLSSLQDGTGTDDQFLTGGSFNLLNGVFSLSIEDGNTANVDLDGRYLEAADSLTTYVTPTQLSDSLSNFSATDTSGYNTALTLAGTTLQLTDGDGTLTQDLSSLQDGTGTDDQTIDVLQLTGTDLEISLEGDGEPTQTVDLSSLQDGTGTDDQNITGSSFNTGTGQLTIGIENGSNQTIGLDGRYLTTEVDGSTTNELQDLDIANLNGTDLELSLTDDPTLHTVDLSSLQDGTGMESFVWSSGLGSTIISDGETVVVQGGANGIDIVGGGTNTLTANLDFQELATVTTVDTDFDFVGQKTGIGQESRIGDEWVQEWIQDWIANSFLIAGDSLTTTYNDPAGTLTIDYTGTGGGGGTDDQTIDTFQITANQLEISLEDDGEQLQTVDLSPYLDNTDDQTLAEVLIEGNSAGANDIDMNNNSVNNMDGYTINSTGDDWLIFTNGANLQWSQTGAGSRLTLRGQTGTDFSRLGVGGISLPAWELDVNGVANADTIRVDGAYYFSTDPVVTSPGDTMVQVWVDSTTAFFLDKSEFGGSGSGDNLGNHIATASLNMDGNEIDSISILNLFDTDGDNNFWAFFEDSSGDLIIQDNDAATDLLTIEQDGTVKFGVTPATDATEDNILVYDATTDEIRIRDASTLGGGGSFGGIPIGADVGANATLEEGELIEFVGGSTIETDLSADSTQLVINQTARMLETATTNQLPTTLSGTFQTVWTGSIGAGEIDDNGDSYFNLYSYFLVTELGTATEFLDGRILVDGVEVYSQDFFHRATISDETFFVTELKVSESRDDEDDIWVTTLVSGQRVVRKESLPAGTLSGAITIQVQVRLNDGSGNVSVEPENDHTWYERL